MFAMFAHATTRTKATTIVSSVKISQVSGPTGMRERLEMVGGQLDVRSEPAQGFHVNASIPLPGGVA